MKTLKRGLYVVGCLLIMITALILVPEITSNDPVCVRAEYWVQDHDGNLPRTLDRIAAFPPQYIRSILSALPAEERCAIWREHLSRVLIRHPEFTPAQTDVVHYFLSLLSPELFTTSRDDIRWGLKVGVPIALLGRKIEQAFPDETQRRVLDLGVGYPSSWYLPALRIRIVQRFRKMFIVAADDGGPCECSADGGCTDAKGGKCDQGPCTWTPTGCGYPPYLSPCTKMCSYGGEAR